MYKVNIQDGYCMDIPDELAEKDLSITEYISSIGKVISLEPDGRAKIIVKVA